MPELTQDFDQWMSTHSLLGWIVAFAVAAALTAIIQSVMQAFLTRLSRLAAKTKTEVDELVVDVLSATRTWVLFAVILYSFVHVLQAPDRVVKISRVLITLVTGLQICLWGLRAIQFWRKNYLARKATDEASSIAAIGLLATSLQGLLIVVVLLIVLSNLGIDVAALITGLGVGGIAVALAAQNILGDLLASLSIVLDKPFVVGDFIMVGNDMGAVENIGLKTTRLRSLSGEELIFSNKDLLESRIRNFKRMWQRRVEQKLSFPLSTPKEKIKAIPGWIRDMIQAVPEMHLDRSHVSAVTSTAVEVQYVYFVKDPDYNKFMDLQQALFFQILDKCALEKVELMVPTPTVLLTHSETVDRKPLPELNLPPPPTPTFDL